jgi:hypothetical protein
LRCWNGTTGGFQEPEVKRFLRGVAERIPSPKESLADIQTELVKLKAEVKVIPLPQPQSSDHHHRPKQEEKVSLSVKKFDVP